MSQREAEHGRTCFSLCHALVARTDLFEKGKNDEHLGVRIRREYADPFLDRSGQHHHLYYPAYQAESAEVAS